MQFLYKGYFGDISFAKRCHPFFQPLKVLDEWTWGVLWVVCTHSQMDMIFYWKSKYSWCFCFSLLNKVLLQHANKFPAFQAKWAQGQSRISWSTKEWFIRPRYIWEGAWMVGKRHNSPFRGMRCFCWFVPVLLRSFVSSTFRFIQLLSSRPNDR